MVFTKCTEEVMAAGILYKCILIGSDRQVPPRFVEKTMTISNIVGRTKSSLAEFDRA